MVLCDRRIVDTVRLRHEHALGSPVRDDLHQPPDSNVIIDDVIHLQAPGAVTLSRKANHLAKIDKVGYVPTTIAIERT